jgi:hypothetical protein
MDEEPSFDVLAFLMLLGLAFAIGIVLFLAWKVIMVR